MATGIQITPPNEITIGTTSIISGTNGTLLRNEGGLVGDTDYTVPKTDGSASQVLQTNGAGVVSWQTISTGITVGTTAVTSGTDGRVFFQAGGVVQQDSALFWDNTNKRLGVGATPSTSVRLDVRAQGALSTDIAFRVRNSADTANLYYQDGTGFFIFRNNAGNKFVYWDAANILQLGTSGGQTFTINTESTAVTRITTTSDILFSGVSSHVFIQYKNGNFQLEQASGVLQTSGAGGLSLRNGTAPSANTVDRFTMYSADIVAGNAAPHFRTENGDVIKLYKETGTSLGSGATFTNGSGAAITEDATFGGLTLAQIAKALGNLGLVELTA